MRIEAEVFNLVDSVIDKASHSILKGVDYDIYKDDLEEGGVLREEIEEQLRQVILDLVSILNADELSLLV